MGDSSALSILDLALMEIAGVGPLAEGGGLGAVGVWGSSFLNAGLADIGGCTGVWFGAMEVASESVDSVIVLLLEVADCVEEETLRTLVFDPASSTIACFDLGFDGVLGFDVRADDGPDFPSSIVESRRLSFDLTDSDLQPLISLELLLLIVNFFLNSSAAFCRSTPLFLSDRTSFCLSSLAFSSTVVSGGLGGAIFALLRCSSTTFCLLPFSRSVGSGV